MNSKTTGIWFTIAAALFALIYIFEHFLRPAAAESSCILPELRPAAVTSVQVIPSGALEIRADRTNGTWRLIKPIAYPAQPAGHRIPARRASKTHGRHPHQRRRAAQPPRCGHRIRL
jgi:hypothetical protein